MGAAELAGAAAELAVAVVVGAGPAAGDAAADELAGGVYCLVGGGVYVVEA